MWELAKISFIYCSYGSIGEVKGSSLCSEPISCSCILSVMLYRVGYNVFHIMKHRMFFPKGVALLCPKFKIGLRRNVIISCFDAPSKAANYGYQPNAQSITVFCQDGFPLSRYFTYVVISGRELTGFIDALRAQNKMSKMYGVSRLRKMMNVVQLFPQTQAVALQN